MTHKGSCHCGQVKFEVEGTFDTAMECNCSHCSRKGYLLWFVPRTQFQLQSPESAVAIYTFNKHAIKHQLCIDCGVDVFARGTKPDGSEVVALNVSCIDGIELSKLAMTPVDGRNR